MQTLTYVIGKDRRALVSDVQDFRIDFKGSEFNWVQARQYENAMRQVFVNVKNEDGTPFDLTGSNIWFEGVLPDKTHKILDAKHAVLLDPVAGQFRFDLPAQAFAVSGSYVQAFFRIVKDGNSITTLEFSLEVLADKVISGLIPRDYITPFEDLYDQLQKVLEGSDGKLQDKLNEWDSKFKKTLSDLETIGHDTQTWLDVAKDRLKLLEDKIKQDGLFTKDEADILIRNINESLSDYVKQFDDTKGRIESRFNDLATDPITHKLKYHSVSVSISPRMNFSDKVLDRLKNIGASITLCNMVNINSKTDSNPQLESDRITDAITRIQSKGLKIDMLKPHIGLNWSDSFYRGEYVPDSNIDFFNNWKQILLKCAEICKQKDIPILCIGCEQVQNTQAKFSDKWLDIISEIRQNYPKLLLTYAMAGQEHSKWRDREWMGQLDFIGMNVYPSYVSKEDSGDNISVEEVVEGFYYDHTGTAFGKRMREINRYFNKPIFITEVGVMPQRDGLVTLIGKYTGQTPQNFHVPALAMEAAFAGWMKDLDFVIGFAWWHVREPFEFFDENSSTMSEAEQVFKKYVIEGRI
ncbi:MAG: BppU family phage baseplate upper protein [Ligilactobacillus animalis]|uniref:BppU family phage baseplate upper protein n=1 Tax=Ligilactobacillus animalis TaxID=1605 RepID=UPI00242B6EA8|nr:BppU family phage baseplate upper protein [Ligilactobacillus animalis]MCI5942903.1 BppU family phage baseplate upper protein [Ligilactobacillus animalis]MDY2993737.1 BppU family phage baseplate upper protein [Ligilactobacillus animalis]